MRKNRKWFFSVASIYSISLFCGKTGSGFSLWPLSMYRPLLGKNRKWGVCCPYLYIGSF